jgi:hypothetical protein
MTTHTAKTTAEVRKSNRYAREIRVPFIRLRGQWLKEHGFYEGTTAYITETPAGLLITATPPNPPELTPLDQIKAQFRTLNIPTER